MRFRNELLNGTMYTPPSVCFADDGNGGGGGGGDDAAKAAAAAAAAAAAQKELPAWLQGATLNEHHTALLKNKSWGKDTPVTAVLDAYANAEKALGGDKILLPKGDSDQAGWDALFKAIGRPDAPDKYDLKGLPEGFDKDLVEGFKKTAHASGLGGKQANAIVAWFAEHGAKVANDRQANIDSRNELELQKVMTEQGANYKEYTKIGLAAATALGISEEEIDQMESVWGTKKTLDRLYAMGKGMKEGRFAASDNPNPTGGAMTPGEALAEIAKLKNDAEWQKKYRGGDADARNRWKALHAWAYPE